MSLYRVVHLHNSVELFAPDTGQRLRIDSPQLGGVRQTAPRSIQFALTNHCNLACSFCSRPHERKSTWTVESALGVLADLDRAGLTEVAFGGGEPLVFRGFFDLVDALVRNTRLAVHLTTNGLLLTDAALDRLHGKVGEIRLSLYDNNDWRSTIDRLVRRGVRFGVNLLVTPDRVAGLEVMIDDLADRGCRDVLLLPALGVPSLALSASDAAQLAELLARREWPFPIKLSVCWGTELDGLRRLFESADCGAGSEFLEITSDKHVRPCSFHEAAVPFDTAEGVIEIWQNEQRTLAQHAGCSGCTRGCREPRTDAVSPANSVRSYNAFASNNSGSYTLIGQFKTTERAAEIAALLTALSTDMEAMTPGQNPLHELLTKAGIPAEPAIGLADDWPAYGSPPAAVQIDQQVWWYADYTVTMPSEIGHWFFQMGGKVNVELDHSHHPLLASFDLWPDLPWAERRKANVEALKDKLWSGPLSGEDVKARLRTTDWKGLELLWLDPSPDEVRALMITVAELGMRARLSITEAFNQKPDLDTLWAKGA